MVDVINIGRRCASLANRKWPLRLEKVGRVRFLLRSKGLVEVVELERLEACLEHG